MIIVGLGNPEAKYIDTRHNIGFRVLDALASTLATPPWKEEQGVAWTKHQAHWLIKPLEFMNQSGQSYAKFSRYKIGSIPAGHELMVVYDDVDFPLGTLKPDFNRSSGGHQGVQSMIDALGTQEFGRLRIGIGSNREQHIPSETYVLQQFTTTEQPTIKKTIHQAVEYLQETLDN